MFIEVTGYAKDNGISSDTYESSDTYDRGPYRFTIPVELLTLEYSLEDGEPPWAWAKIIWNNNRSTYYKLTIREYNRLRKILLGFRNFNLIKITIIVLNIIIENAI